VIKAKLAKAHSKVHISFDGCTAPNHRAFIGIVVHWLGENLKKQDLQDCKESKAHTVVRIVTCAQIIPNLGFFIADNAGPNDTAIRATVFFGTRIQISRPRW
jgi:hypothetical protein